MPICIECRYPVKTLYTTYSKADDRALGKGVRLTQCPRCKRFADKYVEHDNVVLFIDLVLIKPQVYRHLLFNRLAREDYRFDPRIIRLSILLLLFDVYLTWARIEKATPNPDANSSNDGSGDSPLIAIPPTSSLVSQPLVLQYLFFLALVSAQTLAFHAPIQLLCSQPPRIPARFTRFLISDSSTTTKLGKKSTTLPPSPPSPTLNSTVRQAASTATGNGGIPLTNSGGAGSTTDSVLATSPPSPIATTSPPGPSSQAPLFLLPHYPHPVPLSTALLVSSCTKLLPLLLIVWQYDDPSAALAVSWAVFVNNVAALEILMDCGHVRAVALVAIGASARAAVGWALLKAVGLEGMVGVGEGNPLDIGRGLVGQFSPRV